MKRANIGADELGGLDSLARFSSKHLRVGNQIAIDVSRELDCKLHRPVVKDVPIFSLDTGFLHSLDRVQVQGRG